jgi:hypothetical protein
MILAVPFDPDREHIADEPVLFPTTIDPEGTAWAQATAGAKRSPKSLNMLLPDSNETVGDSKIVVAVNKLEPDLGRKRSAVEVAGGRSFSFHSVAAAKTVPLASVARIDVTVSSGEPSRTVEEVTVNPAPSARA